MNISNYSFIIPLYLVAITSMFLGLFLSLIISFFENLSSGLTIWGKEHQIKKADKQIKELANRVHQLELENTKLQTKEETEKEESRLYPHHGAVV